MKTEQEIWPLPPSQVLSLHLIFHREKKRRLLVPRLYHWSLPKVGPFYHPGCPPLAMSFSLSNTGGSFLRLPVFVKLVLLGYCLLPTLSERKLPEQISCGVQTVAPSLFSPLKKKENFQIPAYLS